MCNWFASSDIGLLSQARLEISVLRNVHWIDNINFRSARCAYIYITDQIAK